MAWPVLGRSPAMRSPRRWSSTRSTPSFLTRASAEGWGRAATRRLSGCRRPEVARGGASWRVCRRVERLRAGGPSPARGGRVVLADGLGGSGADESVTRIKSLSRIVADRDPECAGPIRALRGPGDHSLDQHVADATPAPVRMHPHPDQLGVALAVTRDPCGGANVTVGPPDGEGGPAPPPRPPVRL